MAVEVWRRFGDVKNYVEPFFGSGAVLLQQPDRLNGITETVNDADCYLANFWRAVQNDPDGVAQWADYPVSEVDLIARHRWLIAQQDFIQRMKTEPDYYDIKLAGWWVWGKCAWIGAGFCVRANKQLPHLGNAGQGINRKLPHLGDAGRGINRKLPHLGNAGQGIKPYLQGLSNRLRNTRIASGDWSRVLSDSVTWRHGLTGVFLDPPYDSDCSMPYAEHCNSTDVAAWAINHGDNPALRIALCGYDGEHAMPESWDCYAWKANGGYGNQGDDYQNSSRERIWFSPHCLQAAKQTDLFDDVAA